MRMVYRLPNYCKNDYCYCSLMLVEIAKFVGRSLESKLLFHHLLFIEPATYILLVLTQFLRGTKSIFPAEWCGLDRECLSFRFPWLVHLSRFFTTTLKWIASQILCLALICLHRSNSDFQIRPAISISMKFKHLKYTLSNVQHIVWPITLGPISVLSL